MTTKEILRLSVYGLAGLAAAIIAILAYLKGDIATMTTALAWIATNILAAVHTPGSDTQPDTGGDHAA